MFEDLDDKTVGDVRSEVKQLVKDFMVDFDEVFTTVIGEFKTTLSNNKAGLSDVIDDLNEIGDKIPKDTVKEIIDIIFENFSTK